jgi:hypothetical protein
VELCGLCGEQQSARPWQEVIKDTYTTQLDLKTPWVCWACEACLNDRRSRSNVLVANGVYSRPERKQVWPLILNPPAAPFLLYLTLSGKKHGLWKQHVATSREMFRLQCEDLWCMFSPEQDRAWMIACARLLYGGARRDNIETGHYHSGDHTAVGLRELRGLETAIKPVRGTNKFALVFGTMPGRDDIEEVL